METIPASVKTLITWYNKYNHTSLDKNHLMCNKCNKWLSSPIYLLKNGQNVCGTCLITAEDGIQNLSLEQLLEGRKYPCKNQELGCNIFCKSIQEHEEICSYYRRCLCHELVGTQQGLIKHLKQQHSMETIKLSKPVADFSIKKPEIYENGFYSLLLEAGDTKLIVLVQPGKLDNEFYISIYNGSEINREIIYLVKIISDNIYYNISGAVINTIDLIYDDKLMIPHLNQNEIMKCKIYFDNYQNFEPCDKFFSAILKDYECPVCLESITESCYQCRNGHNICPYCKLMINSCPLCRLPINEERFNTRDFTSLIQKMCKYAPNGCFAHDSIKYIKEHEKECFMKVPICELCQNLHLSRRDYFDHMQVVHHMQCLENVPITVKPGYLSFRGNVFKLDFDKSIESVAGNVIEKQMKIKWNLRSLYDGLRKGPFFYELRVWLLKKYVIIDSIVANEDEENSLLVSWVTKDIPVKLTLNLVLKE